MQESESASVPLSVQQHRSPMGGFRPFLLALWRGLAVLLPPLLTIVIFLWIGGTVKSYILDPLFLGSRYVLIATTASIVHEKDVPESQRRKPVILYKNKEYSRVEDGTYVPSPVMNTIQDMIASGSIETPQTGLEVYHRFIEHTYLKPHLFFPVFCILFILFTYLLGKFIAAGIGRFFWTRFEKIVEMVPLVREVYGAVKQVSDFILSEHNVQFSRVVAVQWPRQGVWSLAFVTSEGLLDIEKAVGEPVYAVLIPTSPMPMTGFTMHVKRSETIELTISLDQALQVIVSCGVVIPGRKQSGTVQETLDVVNRAIDNG